MRPQEFVLCVDGSRGRDALSLHTHKTLPELIPHKSKLSSNCLSARPSPQALEQAAAIRAKEPVSRLLARCQASLSLLNKAEPKTGNNQASVASTWALNFKEIEQDPVAADILRVSAFLSPIRIALEPTQREPTQQAVLAGVLATSRKDCAQEALAPSRAKGAQKARSRGSEQRHPMQ